jgi:hypothetical protein
LSDNKSAYDGEKSRRECDKKQMNDSKGVGRLRNNTKGNG